MKHLTMTALLVSVLLSCNFISGERIDGNGIFAAESRHTGTFRNIEAEGPLDIVLTQAPGTSVQIKGDQNLLPYIVAKTNNKTLYINIREGYRLYPEKHLVVYVSSPAFTQISLGGSGSISTQNTITNEDKLSFSLSGSGNIDADIDASSVESHTSGSGDINIQGEAEEAYLSVSGSGDIHCFGLRSKLTNLKINGSGNADVYATRQLTLTVNGSGDVRYKGGAQVNSHINGSGNVKKAD